MSGSNIDHLVDYTATVAAKVQGVTLPNGEEVGVRSVYGAGQGFYDDPLRPGQTIQPVPETPTETFQHWSELPDAPALAYDTQSGTMKIEWDIPMRLVLARGDLATTRTIGLPFYDAYIEQFWLDRYLGSLCNLAYIRSFARGGDGTWAWLEMHLYVREYVDYS